MSQAPARMGTAPAAGWFWLVVAVTGVSFAFLARHLVFPDLVQSYPFPGGDGHDWISNGLHWAGLDVRYTIRPPLLPLLIAALAAANTLELLPILPLLAVHSCAIACFLVLRARTGAALAAMVSLTLLFNPVLLATSFEVMADALCGCLLFGAVIAFWRSRERPDCYLAAGVLGGLAAVTQQSALLLPLAAAPIMLGHRRSHLRSPWLWTGALALAAPSAAWLLGKLASYGTVSGVGVTQWGLLRFHVDAVLHYALGASSLLGLPGLVLAAAGAALAVSRNRRDDLSLLATATVAVLLGFFVLLYDFPDRRFLLHIHWLFAVLIGDALVALRRPAARALAAGALFVWGVLPSPGVSANQTTVVLSPAPPVHMRFPTRQDPVTGAVTAAWGAPELIVSSLAQQASSQPHVVARRAFRQRSRQVGPDRELFAQDHSVLLLYRSPAGPEDRYLSITRTGNLLGKRVKLVPAELVEQHLGVLAGRRLTSLEDREILRARVAGLDESWLLLVPQGDPLVAALALADTDLGNGEYHARTALATATSLLAATRHPDPEMHLGVVAEPGDIDLSALFVALLATTSNLRFADAQLLAQVESAASPAPRARDMVVDGIAVRHLAIFGQPAAVIVYPATHPPGD